MHFTFTFDDVMHMVELTRFSQPDFNADNCTETRKKRHGKAV